MTRTGHSGEGRRLQWLGGESSPEAYQANGGIRCDFGGERTSVERRLNRRVHPTQDCAPAEVVISCGQSAMGGIADVTVNREPLAALKAPHPCVRDLVELAGCWSAERKLDGRNVRS